MYYNYRRFLREIQEGEMSLNLDFFDSLFDILLKISCIMVKEVFI